MSPVDSWGRAALADTLQASYGAGSDIDLPDEIRFLRGVSRAAKKRFGKPQTSASSDELTVEIYGCSSW